MARKQLGVAPTDPTHLARLIDVSGGGSGGSASRALAIARLQKAAIDSAAIRGGGIPVMPTAKKPTITVLPNSGDLPTFPNYYRYWIEANNPVNGEGGLGRFIVGGTAEGWAPVFGGGVNFNSNDGSSTVYYAPKDSGLTALWVASGTLAFYFDGRYLAVPCRHWDWQLFVDDEIYSDTGPIAPNQGTNNATIQLDFGTRGWRKILLRSSADLWLPEILCQRGDTLVPLTKDQLGLTINFGADSYGQYGGRALSGLPYLQFIGALVNSRAGRENAIGGTGFASPNANDPATYPAIIQNERLTDINYGTPDIVAFLLGVNDAYPVSLVDGVSTLSAISLALSTTRTNHPDALLYCVSPLTLEQNKAENPTLSPMQVRDAIKTILNQTAGPWIMADSLAGLIYTSDGKTLADGNIPWITGNGNIGNVQGEGNSDVYVGTDDHPSQPAGYRYLGYRLAGALAKGILSLEVPSSGGGGVSIGAKPQIVNIAVPYTTVGYYATNVAVTGGATDNVTLQLIASDNGPSENDADEVADMRVTGYMVSANLARIIVRADGPFGGAFKAAFTITEGS